MIADKLAGRMTADAPGVVFEVLLDIYLHPNRPRGLSKGVLVGMLRLVDEIVAAKVEVGQLF